MEFKVILYQSKLTIEISFSWNFLEYSPISGSQTIRLWAMWASISLPTKER